jgi:triacylglycerol lipase
VTEKLRKLIIIILLMCCQSNALADCVVLLHGLARTSKAMDKLASELAEVDYKVANIDYPSRERPIEELSPLAISEGIRQCQTPQNEKIHFVTHSMGGILIRYYLESNEIDNLGHVVMIAPPNQGSEVVDKLSGVPGYAVVNGPAGQQLGTDPNSIPSNMGPVDYSVGVIAGNKTFNPLLSQFLPNPDDGKVSVERTKVEGMADFVVVNASHPFIMEDDEVIGYTLRFLKSGSFGVGSP